MNSQKTMRGISLVEVMVSVGLSVFLSTAIVDVTLTASRVNRQSQLTSEMVENGRYLRQLLNAELSLAGFYDWSKVSLKATSTRADYCTGISAADLTRTLAFALDGADDMPAGERLCGGDKVLAASDVLLIRRASTRFVNTATGLIPSQHYIQSYGDYPVVATGANNAEFSQRQKDSLTLAPIRLFTQTIYYVDDHHVFKRRRLLKGKYSPAEPLVEGVDDFQVEYGIDRSGNGMANAEGSMSAYVELPVSAQEWADVVSIKYHLLLSSTQSAPAVKTKKYYAYADKVNVSFDDGKVRRLFSGVTQLRNISDRRVE